MKRRLEMKQAWILKKNTETRCNGSVAKKRDDGETTRSEAENVEREPRDTCPRECLSHRGVDDMAAWL